MQAIEKFHMTKILYFKTRTKTRGNMINLSNNVININKEIHGVRCKKK